MADLTFTIPLPPREETEEGAFLKNCKNLAWAAVGELEEGDRRSWPTEEKVRCEIKIFGPVMFKKPIKDLDFVARAICGVLWHPERSKALLLYSHHNSDNAHIEINVTRRKLISQGAGNHYEF